ncbi:MAG: ATP-binding protein [Thermacetogeniaceae bacterium]
MLIRELFCKPVGPLEHPVLFRPERPCIVIFDENEAGKTAFVDVAVNLLFRKSSARSRFQSKRFQDYEGYVRIEHKGEEFTFRGGVDLDRQLGFPPQFSRLPIVRGGDLAFLWSGERERKASLIDACIQHFASDLRESLDAVIRNIRSEAGLTAKRNAWSQSALNELRHFLDLYRAKDVYLGELSEKERLRRRLQELERDLDAVREEIQAVRRSLKELEAEKNAALCAKGRLLLGRFSELSRRYRDAGYERCAPEDAVRWAEIEAKLNSLRERKLLLQQELASCEAELQRVREELEFCSLNSREAEAVFQNCRAALDAVVDEASRRRQLLSNALGEMRSIFANARSAAARRVRARWALFAVPVLAVAAALLFCGGLFIPGGILAAICVGAAGWGGAVAASCRQAEREAAERAFRLLQGFGIEPPVRLDAAISAFERYSQEEEERLKKRISEADQAYRDAAECHQRLLSERSALIQKSEAIRDNLQRLRSGLSSCERELAEAEQGRQDLMARTGKPSRLELEKALHEKAEIEKEMAKIRAQLEAHLGSPEEWQLKLAGLEKCLERYPNPRSLEELEQICGEMRDAEVRLKEREQLLQGEREELQQQLLQASRRLLAAGCDEVGSLANRIAEAERVLKEAIRKALAAVWAQKVIAAARGSAEDALLEPLTRASEIFRRITGRYEHISYSRQDGDISFWVSGGGRIYSEDVLSDGTRAQFLLTLRLALLERFLEGEKGFLILDDPLLGSSDERRERVIGILLDYARSGWQVVYLTVDSAVPRIFMEQGGDLVALKRVKDLYQPLGPQNES